MNEMQDGDVYSSDAMDVQDNQKGKGTRWRGSDGGSTLRNVGCDLVVVGDLWVWSLKTHGFPPRPCLIASLPRGRGETVNCSWGILCHTALLLADVLLSCS